MVTIRSRLGCTSLLSAVAYGSITWSCTGLEGVRPSCLRPVLRPWRHYDSTRRMFRLVSGLAQAYEFGLMVNRSFPSVPKFRSITAQSPPVSASRRLGEKFQISLLYHGHEDILDDHIPCLLRTCCRPWAQHGDSPTLGRPVVSDIGDDE
jgi:hypothetical protein